MLPVLFHIGSTPIWSHGVFVALGLLLALRMAWLLAQRHGRATPEFIWILSGGLVGAAIVARFGLLPRYLVDANAPSVAGFLGYGGRSLLGGLAGGYLGVIVTKRLIGYTRHTGDLLVPGVALGIAVGRVGCHLAEEPGSVTTLPWGVHVTPPLDESLRECVACLTGAAMHPSFLYESLFLLVIGLWLYPYARRADFPARWMREGDLFKLFLLLYAAARFLLEYVRGSPTMLFGLSGSQLAVLVPIVTLPFYFIQSARAARNTERPA
jgi:phosphatidylglycerol---prolipoprotein diacylglyceryl transferase